MTTSSSVMAEARLGSSDALAAISPLRQLYWSVKRELWESRWVYYAPAAAGALFVIGFAISSYRLPETFRAAIALDPEKQRAALAMPYDFAGGLMMLMMMIVGVFYCLDALYGERRDRSSLFWKSLPVSDTIAVLAKASIPIIVLPLVAFAVAFAMELIMLVMSSLILAASGQSVSQLWDVLSFGRMSLLLLYHLIAGHALWHAPFYGYLLFVSAWARRTPFIWAFVPPLALCYLEKIAFNTNYLATMLWDRFANGTSAMTMPHTFPTHPMTQITLGRYLASPGLWIGFALTALFLFGAIRLRRSAGPV